ncbi:MAG: hypothetical protein PF495_12550 [Spirochaetales bacterium]|nr:hypothetical protein [Spirochaetales bacterium]
MLKIEETKTKIIDSGCISLSKALEFNLNSRLSHGFRFNMDRHHS